MITSNMQIELQLQGPHFGTTLCRLVVMLHLFRFSYGFIHLVRITTYVLFLNYSAKVGCPLVVEFLGENGIDRGGLRKDLLNLLLDLFDEGISTQQHILENGSLYPSSETSRFEAEERLYAYGLFSSIALIQATITKAIRIRLVYKIQASTLSPVYEGT